MSPITIIIVLAWLCSLFVAFGLGIVVASAVIDDREPDDGDSEGDYW